MERLPLSKQAGRLPPIFRCGIMGRVVAVDIGTSGIRGKLLDPADGSTIRTCITTRNPIPGANVMDHMSFAMEFGADFAHGILLSAVHDVVRRLKADSIDRLAVCGNPIQLSLFEGIDIRDLAFAGENKLKNEGIVPLERSGHVVDGEKLGFPGTEILIPPAVKHEIGADALAMMLKSGFLDDDMCMVTDYGTNAEMALKVGDDIYTGSAAAGPAMEGQQIRCGMVAGPGAVSDLVRTPEGWRSMVLDEDLIAREGPMLNLRSDISRPEGRSPVGITGTGVVALVYAGLQDGRIEDATVRNEPIRINRKVTFDSKDLKEAGKAIGAIRAGHMTLMIRAGVDPEEIRTMYMAGATGTYVDPFKSKSVGLIIPDAERVVQVGNTSLELARDLALDPGMLDDLNSLRDRLVTEHTMFASSDVFRDLYLYEFGYWNDGMPLSRYRRALERYGMEGYLDRETPTRVEKVCIRDIRDIGESLEIATLPTSMNASWDCSRCMACVNGCVGKAMSFDGDRFSIRTGDCLGTACMKCRESCPQGVFSYQRFKLDE